MHGLKPLKDKKGKAVINAFIKIENGSNLISNKSWNDQQRKFYDKLKLEYLDHNYIFMYSTHNEGKSVIAERFIKTLKAKIYKLDG